MIDSNDFNPIKTGTFINGCRIIEEIGTGGMGSVYKALDEGLSRPVAIKIMHQSPNQKIAITRFKREAAAIAKLDHPGIIKIFSFGEYQGQPFFIMEHVEGWSIKDFTGRCRVIHLSGHSPEELRLSGYLKDSTEIESYFRKDPQINPLKDSEYPARIRKLISSAAAALEAAHGEGIIHRDIKSSNILISNDSQVKLIDFGLVKHRDDSELTRHDQFMGTLSYASPEQLMGERGRITPATDIYSLGIVMYELATLQHPIKGEDPAAIVASITNGRIIAPTAINPHISRDFESIILKCLNRDPLQRFKSSAELADVLTRTNSQSTWFSGFTEILKGWFFRETRPVKQPLDNWTGAKEGGFTLQPEPDSQKIAAQRFLKTARKKFFHNFAVMEAIEDLKQAYALNPGCVDTLFLLCFAHNAIAARSEVKPLIEKSELLISRESEKDLGKFAMIRDIFLDRDYEEGRKKAERLKAIYAEDQDFHFAQFFCLEALGNYSEAILVGERLSKLSRKNNVVAVAQSECYFSVMDFERAISVLKDRIALNPEFHNLRLKCVQALILSGRLQQARMEAEEVLRQNPQNMLMQFYYGRTLTFLGEYKDAFSAFRQAVGLPGDESLRAMGYYSLYRLMNLQNKELAGVKFLEQARTIKPEIDFKRHSELEKSIREVDLSIFKDEFSDGVWYESAIDYTRLICLDSIDLRSYTIGNYGCTSILIVKKDGVCEQHLIFANYNLYENEEMFTQLWLPEFPQSPFIDENGNILTSSFFKQNGPLPGGIVSITFAKPWKSGSSSYIYCRMADFKLANFDGTEKFILPELPQPACRKQAFIVVLPSDFEVFEPSVTADERRTYESHQTLCYFPYLRAGEIFNLSFRINH